MLGHDAKIESVSASRASSAEHPNVVCCAQTVASAFLSNNTHARTCIPTTGRAHRAGARQHGVLRHDGAARRRASPVNNGGFALGSSSATTVHILFFLNTLYSGRRGHVAAMTDHLGLPYSGVFFQRSALTCASHLCLLCLAMFSPTTPGTCCRSCCERR